MGRRGIQMSIADVEAHQRRHGFLTPIVRPPEPTTVAPASPNKLKRARQPNKTESEFGRILEARRATGHFSKITFEGATLRLADRLRYTPDWMCETCDKTVTFFEVKGPWIDGDSIPKFKMAREQHKWANFEMWQKKKGQWERVF